ncbi:DUF2461 domain-containing protein [Microlunatus soli]|uniref:TIGR02453 family protein n=1 Tax=Microlunatus soli TaxID=630515 RepID=A0A1H1ZLF1_9ACTN|nr:DUF2461 domain-containing protein [Microlunatus soli]SDT34407.1 TIGR02453 family protein [Microlunatus soli]
MSDFTGFSIAALDFYDDLELDNSKSFWSAHKATYDEHVRAPMLALTQALETEFGAAKIFRPYRDVRFAKDKTPYKTHQGAFVATAEATGWYVELGAAGVRIAAGFYHAGPPALDRYRRTVADDVRGPELERLLARLRRAGWELGGDRLKTSPRGFSADHPRIELLRHRSLTLGKSFGFEPIIHSAELATAIGKEWRKARPLVEWITRYVSG